MYTVYVLLCSDGSLYTGIAKDVQNRFIQHLAGSGGAYTRSHPPVRIVFRESHPDRSSALRREALIKSWPRNCKVSRLGIVLQPGELRSRQKA